MNKQQRIAQKKQKRKKKVANKKLQEQRIKLKNKGLSFRTRKLAYKEQLRINNEAVAKKLRGALGLPEDDKTPLNKLVEAFNLYQKNKKIEE